VSAPPVDLDPTALWRRLARGGADPRAAFRTMIVSTIGLDGAPQSRTVVLRGVDEAARRIWFHTDARSPKAAEIQADPRVALLFWDAKAQLQLRCAADVVLRRDDAFADVEWARLSDVQRAVYETATAPGALLDADPSSARGRAVFVIASCAVKSIDALVLGRDGHRRLKISGGETSVVTP